MSKKSTTPPTGKTYRFATFQEMVDVLPHDRIRECMDELGKTLAVAKGTTELMARLACELGGKPFPEGEQIIQVPPVFEWVDDGKGECEASISDPQNGPLLKIAIGKK